MRRLSRIREWRGACQPRRMNSDYAWSPTANPISDTLTPARELPHDIASVAGLWVSTAYDDLRRARPDRATQVRWIGRSRAAAG